MPKKHILVVDDDAAVTYLTKQMLETSGEYEVSIVNQSHLALQAVRRLKPDLILLDVVMPGMDGGDVRRQLQNDWSVRSIPVLFMTALVSHREVSAHAVVESGGETMLPKPVSPSVLKRCIAERLACAA